MTMLCKTRLFSIFLPFAIFFTGVSCAEQHCDQINKTIPNLHLHCGYNLTARYTHGHHFNSASRAIISLKNVLKNCSLFVDTMICSLFLPRCTEEISGPYLPCRGVCYDFANDCNEIIRTRGLEWTVAMCDILPEKDNPKTTKGYRERCFTPPNYIVSGKKYKHNCSDVVIPECQRIPGYTKTVVSPSLQRRYAAYIRSKIRYNASDTCSQGRKEIVCAENLPACMDGTVGFLCRDECLRFFNRCKSPFFYGRDMCMEFPEKEDSHNYVVCKQTHWPRSENWPLTETPSATPIAISGTPTSREPSSKTDTDEKPTTTDKSNKADGIPTNSTDKSSTSDENPSTTTDIPSPAVKGLQKDKRSGPNKLLVGFIVTFAFLILIVLGIVGFVWYRRKKVRQFDYQKQVLYSEDREDEFQIFT